MNKAEIIEKHRKYLFSCVANYYEEPLVVDHAKGSTVVDVEGREYLDFFGGIVTISVGHCNEKVTGAIERQTNKLQHVSTLYPNEPHVRLAEKLAEITPGRLQKSFFTNSGTEANETAVLLAQLHTKCQDVIALRHSYSGRSHLAMSLTAHAAWRLTPTAAAGIHHIPNAYCYRCPFGLTYPSCDLKCAKDLEEAIQTQTSGRIAAFIAEPIQGIGGFITPPKEYFQVIASILRQYGGLFICDEVQTGWGRTGGKMFGIEQWGVEPDIMTFAKGMANGVPIGATIARAEIADSMKGMTISTFGGNPVTSAAALATIQVIEEENLVDNARVMGRRLREGLEALKQKYPAIGDVRGMGLMQGLELVGENKRPDGEAVRRLFERTKANGLLIGKGGLMGNVIRITPPLNVTKDEIDRALKLLDQSFAQLGL
ncbi:MAG: aspartate aminotransferase family protein [Deltaproteobacteria bacterium]|nr:aspartate aminotransferase family protein [Deltaproteobacteria bacterium]MBI2209309.1 aspartate aminotransferase family protein [Deltaproteobacteria bacterium]MBI2348456.1 aspartate aminotransferase family protein [Deltaproteobacteria bacterium]MBI2538577.1 aspartate aminotransferase family protein [Deltaproteobacteria bacterium]MBI2991616.1 aspartate aminotransferase family protein [Deltaproteobacteria bacterium]